MSNLLSLLQDVEYYVAEYGTAFIWLLMALPMLAIFAAIVIPFLVRGFKKGALGGLVSLGSTVVAFILSVILSQGLGMLLSKLLVELTISSLFDYLSSMAGDLAYALEPGAYLTALVQWVISALLATVLFLVIFFIALIVCKIVIGKVLSPKKDKNEKKEKSVLSGFGGLGIRLADAVLIAFLFVAPLYSFIGFGGEMIESVALSFDNLDTEIVEEEQQSQYTDDGYMLYIPESEEEQTVTTVLLSVAEPFTDCPLVKFAKIPGLNFGERIFGAFICDGKLYNAYDVFRQGTDMVFLSADLVSGESSGIDGNKVEALKNILAAAEKNDFFYGVFSDVFHVVGNVLDIQLENEKSAGNDTTTLELVIAFYEPFKDCTASDIQSCANALIGVLDSAVKNDLFAEKSDTEHLLKQLASGSFIDESVVLLRSNPLLSNTVDSLLLLSLNYMNFSSNKENGAEFEDALSGLKENVKNNIESGAVDPAKEILAFKTIFNGFFELYQSTNGLKNFNFDEISGKGISDLLTGLGTHPHIGAQGAEDLVNAALPSFGASATILTEDFIKAATNALKSDILNPPSGGAQGKFENLLLTAQSLTSAITNGFGENKNQEKLNDTIDLLLSDMTAESADIVTSVLTKDVMDSINSKGSSSGDTEGFVKDLLSNMASYEPQSKAELEKEREAIIKMNDLVLDVDNKLNSKQEDQTSIEAAVGGDLKEFVNDVSSSSVLMATINDSFEKNPEKTSDPTGMFSSMSQQDKDKLVEVCNELLTDDNTSIEQKNNIKKVCSFMGGASN